MPPPGRFAAPKGTHGKKGSAAARRADGGGAASSGSGGRERIAVVRPDRCKPNKCGQECKRGCPVNLGGKACITVTKADRIASFAESLCIGCGSCVRTCPFGAVRIVNLPSGLAEDTVHRHGANGFKLHRLPQPQLGKITGILGRNGTGKSTAMGILAGRHLPNFGVTARGAGSTALPTELDTIAHFRGSSLQNYFGALYGVPKGKHTLSKERAEQASRGIAPRAAIPISCKPQHVTELPEAVPADTTVIDLVPWLASSADTDSGGAAAGAGADGGEASVVGGVADDSRAAKVCAQLELAHLMHRRIADLSGGELQRVALAQCMCRDADVYCIDEPTSFCDVKQRLRIASLIRGLVSGPERDTTTTTTTTDPADAKSSDSDSSGDTPRVTRAWPSVLLVEHDLSILDFVSDYVCILYGDPGAYGVVSKSHGAATGINHFLRGYIPSGNVRFRDHEVSFRISSGVTPADDADERVHGEGGSGGGGAAASSGAGAGAGKGKAEGNGKASRAPEKAAPTPTVVGAHRELEYESAEIALDGFHLSVASGSLVPGGITLLCGENGCGKTSWMRLMAKRNSVAPPAKSDDSGGGDGGGGGAAASASDADTPSGDKRSGSQPVAGLRVSYKPQKLALRKSKTSAGGKSASKTRTVRSLVMSTIASAWHDPAFQSIVAAPLGVEALLDQSPDMLSGGELQRVALCLCLGKTGTQLFLIDEPSAHLDVEQRLAASKAIKRWVAHCNGADGGVATCVLVEHDFLMATSLADQVVVFSGTPGVACTATRPMGVLAGMNAFLRLVGVTFRRDAGSNRPRMNERGCRRDKEQKKAGTYFFLED